MAHRSAEVLRILCQTEVLGDDAAISDAFGELHDNNAAELLKSIPGMALNYAGGFTMRGQDSTYATIMTDGNPVANGANIGSGGRNVNFCNVSVNNIEPIEINRAPSAAQRRATGQLARRLGQLCLAERVLPEGDAACSWISGQTSTPLPPGSTERIDHESLTVFPAAQLNYSETFRASTAHPIGVVLNATHGGRYLCNYNFNRGSAYVPQLGAGQRATADSPAIASSLVQRAASAGWRQWGYHLNGIRSAGVPVLGDDENHPGHYGFDEWLSASNYFDRDPLLSRNGKFEEFPGDSSVVVTEALKFMALQKAGRSPFLAVIWYGSPHAPMRAVEEDFQGLPDNKAAQHLGEIVGIDRSIGMLRKGLRELGIERDTLVWYCSDNGGLDIDPAAVGNLRGHKGDLFEGAFACLASSNGQGASCRG